MTTRIQASATAALALLALNAAALAGPPHPASSPGAGSSVKTNTTTGTTTTTTTGTGTTTTTGTTGTTTTGSAPVCGPGGGEPGGGHGQSPAILGTITSIDTTAGTITVAPTGGGTASVITLTSSTALIGQQTIAASAIALGDTLEVVGIPLTLQATSIVDNYLPAAPGTTGSTSSGSGATSVTGMAPVPGTLRVVGVVTALSPPTIEVDSSFAITLSTTSSTTFSEVLTLTASQLATGQTVRTQVVKGSTGILTAIEVDVIPAS